MKNLNRILMAGAAVASLSIATTGTAEAASTYASIFGGIGFLQKPGLKGHSHTYTTTSLTLSSSVSADTSFKTGFVVGGDFGVDWGNGIRTELELAARGHKSKSHAHLKTHYTIGYNTCNRTTTATTSNVCEGTDTTFFTQLKFHDTGNVPANINLRAYSLMANAWYDFDTGTEFTPYIGGGFGLAQVQIDGSLAGNKLHEKNDSVFAWQLGAGISVPISKSVKATLDYRYFAANGARLKLEPGFGGGDINADFDDQDVMIGLRFNL